MNVIKLNLIVHFSMKIKYNKIKELTKTSKNLELLIFEL
jgi:hypothetical protein